MIRRQYHTTILKGIQMALRCGEGQRDICIGIWKAPRPPGEDKCHKYCLTPANPSEVDHFKSCFGHGHGVKCILFGALSLSVAILNPLTPGKDTIPSLGCLWFHWLENIFISLTEILKRLDFLRIKLKNIAELNSRNFLPERDKDNSKLLAEMDDCASGLCTTCSF